MSDHVTHVKIPGVNLAPFIIVSEFPMRPGEYIAKAVIPTGTILKHPVTTGYDLSKTIKRRTGSLIHGDKFIGIISLQSC